MESITEASQFFIGPSSYHNNINMGGEGMNEHSSINYQQLQHNNATHQQLATNQTNNSTTKQRINKRSCNSGDDAHKDINTQHPYGRASWRDKKNAEVLEEVATNFPNLLASLLYFIWTNVRTILITLLTNWGILIRHPVTILVRLLSIPVIAVGMLVLGFVFYLERVFHVDLLLQKVSFSAYGGRSIANWGDTNVLTDDDVERGLELLTALPTKQSSEFNCKIAKALLFFASLLNEDEGSFRDALECHKESWTNLQLLNDPGRVYCKDDHDAVGNFAALFKIHNTTTNETALILSFRGTSPLDLNQWLLDCSMSKVDAHSHLFGAVHEGFYRTLFNKRRNASITFHQRLVAEIEALAALDNPDKKPCRLWVTGHSLGAALASLFFVRATKAREIKGIILSDTYTFGSPRVGNLEFRNQFTSLDNSPLNNSSRMYRVYNLNDPVVRIPFGFDDPNILAISKGPSGLDANDYCHVGVPILLHQHTLDLPNESPEFIVETPKDLGMYWLLGLLVTSHVGNVVEWLISWKAVFTDLLAFCKEMSFPTGARLVVNALETSSLMVNHSPSTYCRNLSIKEKLNL